MSIIYRIDQEKKLALVKWDTVVRATDFLAHVQRLSSDSDWLSLVHFQLADLRMTSLDPSMDDTTLKMAADLYGQHAAKLASMKVAVVAGEVFWKAIEFESLILPYGASVVVFNSLSVACTWLDLDNNEIRHTLCELQNQLPDRINERDSVNKTLFSQD